MVFSLSIVVVSGAEKYARTVMSRQYSAACDGETPQAGKLFDDLQKKSMSQHGK
jgi:hypothetical protein